MLDVINVVNSLSLIFINTAFVELRIVDIVLYNE